MDPRADAEREDERLGAFRRERGLPDTTDSVALYLTWVLDATGATGGALRRRLRALDTSAVLRGAPPPSADRHLRTYVRGLHQEAALGPQRNREPLYAEDVRAALDGIAADRRSQAQDVALLLLADATALPADVLRRLSWSQIRLRRDRVDLAIASRPGGRGPSGTVTAAARDDWPCAVRALRDLQAATGPVQGLVFTRRGGQPQCMSTMQRLLEPLAGRGTAARVDLPQTPPDVLAAAVAFAGRPRTGQLRDTALLALGYSACLTPADAMALTVGGVHPVPEGLLVTVPGRRTRTAVPRSPGRHCPVTAWHEWQDRLAEQGRDRPADPAFPRVTGEIVRNNALTLGSLSRIVARRCAAAGLRGSYCFTSLRVGFIRTAARDGIPDHLVLAHAGLRWLHSVELHRNRERLVTHSLAGRVGL